MTTETTYPREFSRDTAIFILDMEATPDWLSTLADIEALPDARERTDVKVNRPRKRGHLAWDLRAAATQASEYGVWARPLPTL